MLISSTGCVYFYISKYAKDARSPIVTRHTFRKIDLDKEERNRKKPVADASTPSCNILSLHFLIQCKMTSFSQIKQATKNKNIT